MSQVPVIEEWKRLGLNWMYIHTAKIGVITIPANGRVQIPQDEFIYKYTEGVIVFYDAVFDHPSCGLRVEWGPEYDSREVTVNFMALSGLTKPEAIGYVMVPPETPFYHLRACSSWQWKDWLRLYLINMDSIPHRCVEYDYVFAVLQEPRKEKK